ncbi:MAG: anaerobic ribonucleoside triphosphate reductase, partial [Oscillospiraceae bacterium]|nr:anaerobic ribonucleoside triphosphate reductase [Oscillospiraceae bacterium]
MITQIRKRDGRTTTFNVEKIAQAIYKAAQSVGGSDYNTSLELADKVCDMIDIKYGKKYVPTVEQVQDLVEKVLMEEGHAKTAKSYILYRSDRTRAREMNTKLMKIYEDLTFTAAKDSDIKRENANINADTAMGTMLKYGSEGAKQFYEMYVLDPRHAKAHNQGDIHIHDLDYLTLTTTCCQIDLIKLFTNGFSTGHGFLREPNDISSYAALACIAIQSDQNDQHGGQSVPNFEYAMADGVKKTYRRKYVYNIARCLEMIAKIDDGQDISDKIFKEIQEEKGIYPVIDNNNGYKELEFEKLCGYVAADTARRIQEFTAKNTLKETDRATYQAMEAIIHNLNT